MTASDEDTAAHSDSASYEELQRQHRADAQSLLPEYAERLSWSADSLRRERQERLRELVLLLPPLMWAQRQLRRDVAGGSRG